MFTFAGLSPRLTGFWQNTQLLLQAVHGQTYGPEDSTRGQVRLQGHTGPILGLRGARHGGEHLQEVRNISGPVHTIMGKPLVTKKNGATSVV